MKVVTNFRTTLSASMTATQSTVPVNSIQTTDATPHTLTIADLDNQVFLTLEPGTVREELVLCTGITDNGDGSGIFTGGTRGLLFYGGSTSGVAGNRYAHQAGSEVRISNVHYIFDELIDNNSDETIGGIKTFTSFPIKSGILIPTADGQFATKKYADTVATGSANYDQNIISGVAGETLVAGNLVYLKVADGRWWKTDATTAATVNGVIFGFAQASASAAGSLNILIGGIDKNQSGLTAGVVYYASDTHGAISSSAGTVNRPVGQGLTTTSIILNQFFITNPTSDQIAAMVGTSGTPSSLNKFVTAADVSNAGVADKIVRLNGTVYPAGSGANLTNLPLPTTVNKVAVFTTPVTVNTSTAETTLWTTNLAGGTLGTANAVEFNMYMSAMGMNSNAATHTYRLYIGTTNIASFLITSGGGTSGYSGFIQGQIIASGATGTQRGSMAWTAGKGTIASAGSGTAQLPGGEGTGTAAEDSTGTLVMKVTVQMSENQAGTTTTMDSCVVKRVY